MKFAITVFAFLAVTTAKSILPTLCPPSPTSNCFSGYEDQWPYVNSMLPTLCPPRPTSNCFSGYGNLWPYGDNSFKGWDSEWSGSNVPMFNPSQFSGMRPSLSPSSFGTQSGPGYWMNQDPSIQILPGQSFGTFGGAKPEYGQGSYVPIQYNPLNAMPTPTIDMKYGQQQQQPVFGSYPYQSYPMPIQNSGVSLQSGLPMPTNTDHVFNEGPSILKLDIPKSSP